MSDSIPMLSRLLLLSPERVRDNLERVRRAGLVEQTPNLWQITLGILRMWHRLAFHNDKLGTSFEKPVRKTWRARLMKIRPLRFPFLLAERAVTPWDLSGLLSSRERLISHLLGAFHPEEQCVYDLQILGCYGDGLEEVAERARKVVQQRDDPRSVWLRDLVVYDGYHEQLLDTVERAIAGDFAVDAKSVDDPDVTFSGYLNWCARQPATPEATLRAWMS